MTPTRPDDKTKAADRTATEVEHAADREPTPEEEQAAPEEVDDDTRRAYQEMAEKGAETQGEGRLP